MSEMPDKVGWFKKLLGWGPALQSWITIGAIFVGGYWTYLLVIKYREWAPQLVIAHEIESLCLTDKHRLVRINARLQNKGRVFINIEETVARAQGILPLAGSIKKALADNTLPRDDGVIAWPNIVEEHIFKEISLEPNEEYIVPIEFVIPGFVEVVKLYTHFPNAERDDGVGWSTTSIYSIESCVEEK